MKVCCFTFLFLCRGVFGLGRFGYVGSNVLERKFVFWFFFFRGKVGVILRLGG